ncbi:MAG: DNA internalization-related competence protein ComEC/Rec2 [Desulfobulbaceae bacterium]|nr:DNA internalization-related competence protein ComEC/Rec2 [Desulfobulbaceae bacterium]
MPVAVFCAVLIVLALWLIATHQRFIRLNPYLLHVFFFVLGTVHVTLSLRVPTSPTDISQLVHERREVSLVGILARSPEITSERTTLLMDIHGVCDATGQVTRAEGLVQLSLFAPPPSWLVPGGFFITRAVVGPVASYGVPGVFDYQEFLSYQGIRASGWIRSPALIMAVNRLLEPNWIEKISFFPERIRFSLSRFLAATMPPHVAAGYQAILLGERANLSPGVMENFKASGSVHLLAISGLHMGLVAFCCTLLISWFLRRSEWLLLHFSVNKVSALLSLVPLTFYAVIAGFNPPVVRSLIMVSTFVFALLVDRQWSVVNNIAIAAFLVLAVDPRCIFTTSFQLTFLAVLSIALFMPDLAKVIEQAPRGNTSFILRVGHAFKKWTVLSLLISIAASLGTAPVLAYQFHRISFVSPLSTILIEPFLCFWSLLFGLAASLLLDVPVLAKMLFSLGGKGIDISFAIADRCARIPWASIWVPTPAVTTIFAWYGALFLWARRRMFSVRMLAIGSVLCVSLGAAPLFSVADKQQGSSLTVLDVGQGSAIVIELPGHEAILIDGGRKQGMSATGVDVGESLIAPFLWHKRIDRLSAIVCTHPDDDHYNGISFLLRQFRPKTLWLNGYESADKGYLVMLNSAKALGIETKVPMPGAVLLQSEGASLSALTGGQEGGRVVEGAGGNNQSLVLRFTHGHSSFLLPSDIEKETESLLAKSQTLSLQADVLVAPHHGSATSSSEIFLEAVAPRYVAISAGQNQTGHFPAPEVMERYTKRGLVILNTAEKGSLFFQTDGNEIEVKSFR